MASGKRLRVAIFDTDIPVPKVRAVRGLYSDIFEGLLHTAASTLPEYKGVALEFEAYDIVKGALPTEEELQKLNGIIITGSAASAYDCDPWILSLNSFLHYTYHTHPSIHLFGSCFGHQILCQALLTPSSLPSCVEQDPSGWEFGLQSVTLSPAFLEAFGPVTPPSQSLTKSNIRPSSKSNQLRLQFVHHDHVVLPSLPPTWHSIGSTSHCALQGVYQPGRVLTYQGHFEFDEFTNAETLRVFGPLAGWSEEEIEGRGGVIDSTKGEDDSLWAAEVVIRFLGEVCGVEEIGRSEMVRESTGREMVEGQQGCAREIGVTMEGLRADETMGQTVM